MRIPGATSARGSDSPAASGPIGGSVESSDPPTGGYGYTLARSIAYAYLPSEHSQPGTEVAVEVFGSWIEGQVADEPLYDPRSERIRS